MKPPFITINTDGGSRGNPGPSAVGLVIRAEEELLVEFGKAIGVTTNNVAEYTAVIEALLWISANREKIGEYSGINFLLDSQLICSQVNGLFRVKQPHLSVLYARVKELEKTLATKITYSYIPREQNKAADAMVNRALDNLL